MTDLIQRLRKNGTDQYDPCGLCDEAADEIERLQKQADAIGDELMLANAEIERLRREVDIQKSMWCECEGERAKLQAVVDAAKDLYPHSYPVGPRAEEADERLRKALAALEEANDG